MSNIPRIYSNLLLSKITPLNLEQERYITFLKVLVSLQQLQNKYDAKATYKKIRHQIDPCNNDDDFFINFILPETDEEQRKKFITARNEFIESVKSYKQAYLMQPWSLLVIGTVGNGKTMLASALLNEYRLLTGKDVYYTTVYDLANDYKNGFKQETLNKYNDCELLCIDEIRDKTMTDYNRELLQQMIDYRYREKLATILISNVAPSEVKKMFEPPYISRLRQGLTVQMTGDDLRTKYHNN